MMDIEATLLDDNTLRIKFSVKEVTRHEVNGVIDMLAYPKEAITGTIASYITFSEVGAAFTFKVHNPANVEEIYFELDRFTFSDYYGSVHTSVYGDHLFGLGERAHNFFLDDGIYTMWAYDNPAEYDELKKESNQGYGVHPVYFARRPNGNYFGVFNLNSNAQRVTLSTIDNGKELEHEITGGIFDLYILTEATPNEVIKRYHKLIGKPLLPPFWSLGWHQARYGYENLA
jgi:alpha-glucosidase (family GH31 glycosyl hydrolase)